MPPYSKPDKIVIVALLFLTAGERGQHIPHSFTMPLGLYAGSACRADGTEDVIRPRLSSAQYFLYGFPLFTILMCVSGNLARIAAASCWDTLIKFFILSLLARLLAHTPHMRVHCLFTRPSLSGATI